MQKKRQLLFSFRLLSFSTSRRITLMPLLLFGCCHGIAAPAAAACPASWQCCMLLSSSTGDPAYLDIARQGLEVNPWAAAGPEPVPRGCLLHVVVAAAVVVQGKHKTP
jgi:hypothetical protein